MTREKRKRSQLAVQAKVSATKRPSQGKAAAGTTFVQLDVRRVLSEAEEEPVAPQRHWVADVPDPKAVMSGLLPMVTSRWVLSAGMQKALRRVRRTPAGLVQVLLCPEDAASEADVRAAVDAVAGGETCVLHLVDVPSRVPLTQTQYAACRAMWPVVRPEKRREEGEGGWEAGEAAWAQACMREALALAKEAEQAGERPCAAVIGNPRTRKVIVRCRDARRRGHPLHHAVMAAIDGVAKAEVADRQAAAAAGSGEGDPSLQAYYCTGMDLFTTDEPCSMCSMALVHSRIRTVYYARADASAGALGSRLRMHVDPNLKHHFPVYAGLCAARGDAAES